MADLSKALEGVDASRRAAWAQYYSLKRDVELFMQWISIEIAVVSNSGPMHESSFAESIYSLSSPDTDDEYRLASQDMIKSFRATLAQWISDEYIKEEKK